MREEVGAIWNDRLEVYCGHVGNAWRLKQYAWGYQYECTRYPPQVYTWRGGHAMCDVRRARGEEQVSHDPCPLPISDSDQLSQIILKLPYYIYWLELYMGQLKLVIFQVRISLIWLIHGYYQITWAVWAVWEVWVLRVRARIRISISVIVTAFAIWLHCIVRRLVIKQPETINIWGSGRVLQRSC